ncbi:PorP/SprF family type IX secretion system membrane protein [Chitinophaga silvisoli]|uniref:Type IX secretion system membrane protein PorP/SprF n=1 Tax=Chitinophaga silvisoli TaxID=2291814 RepID=A0A3E1P2L1_9BACT|nr:PorP/SprF family type IX secretion system membrane protein [Chitinophaga silvisoli]RFM34218.1 type IX secretion system membrane protein PorP/SprF [Chitinophaga silvisoli]
MRRNCRKLFVALCLCLSSRLMAQDIHLSQFYETPILRNPALIGLFNGDYRVQAVYRNQWNSVTIPYQTGAVSGELKFPIGRGEDFLTTGAQFTYDRAGTAKLQAVQILPAINYHKSLSEVKNMFLSVGFMGGFVQRQFDATKLTFNNQYTNGRYDPTVASGEEGRLALRGYGYWDAGAGISFNSTIGEDVNYYIGAALFHFNRPRVSFYKDNSITMDPKYTFNAGITIPMEDRLKLIAQYNEIHEGAYSEYNGGAILGYMLYNEGLESTRGIYGGVFVRWGDAVIPTMRLDMDKYEISMTYDCNISKLKTASQSFGGFELALVFKGFLNSRNSTLDAVHCPRF